MAQLRVKNHSLAEIVAADAAVALGAPGCRCAEAYHAWRGDGEWKRSDESDRRKGLPVPLREHFQKMQTLQKDRANNRAINWSKYKSPVSYGYLRDPNVRYGRYYAMWIAPRQAEVAKRYWEATYAEKASVNFTPRTVMVESTMTPYGEVAVTEKVWAAQTWWRNVYLEGLAVIDGCFILACNQTDDGVLLVMAVRSAYENGPRVAQPAVVIDGKLNWLTPPPYRTGHVGQLTHGWWQPNEALVAQAREIISSRKAPTRGLTKFIANTRASLAARVA
jgi:hypothetical protein